MAFWLIVGACIGTPIALVWYAILLSQPSAAFDDFGRAVDGLKVELGSRLLPPLERLCYLLSDRKSP